MTERPPHLNIQSQYLEEIQTNIRVRPIPWDGYVRANLLTHDEAVLMKSLEKQSRDKRTEVVTKQPENYANAVIDLLDRITRDDVVKYILSLAGDFAVDVEEFTKHLLNNDNNNQRIFQVLTKLLERNDEQIYLLACRALVVFLAIKPDSSKNSNAVQLVFKFLATKLSSSPNANLQDFAVQSYGILLRSKVYREPFWSLKEVVVPPLLKILGSTSGVKGTGGIQLQYYTLLIFWLITFNKLPANECVTKYDLISVLLDICRNAVKEKIVRISVATLVNMVNQAPKVSIGSLISQSAMPMLKTLKDRKWADDELIEDLQYLSDHLQEEFDLMTTFDEYNSELSTKKLKWTPPHRSDSFWRENAFKFKEHDWSALKQLSQLIGTASANDTVTLAVGCNDINRLINEFPESTKEFEKLNTKLKVMELMKHGDSEVRYEALKATQAFISHSFK